VNDFMMAMQKGRTSSHPASRTLRCPGNWPGHAAVAGPEAVRLPRPLAPWRRADGAPEKLHFERLSAVCLKLPSHPVRWPEDDGLPIVSLIGIHPSTIRWVQPSGPVILSAPVFARFSPALSSSSLDHIHHSAPDVTLVF